MIHTRITGAHSAITTPILFFAAKHDMDPIISKNITINISVQLFSLFILALSVK